MARFVTALKVKELSEIRNGGRGSWQLLSPLIYESDVAKMIITATRRFKTDFASIPRLPFVFWVLGDRYRKAAVIHDFLYTSHETTRRMADAVLFEACKVIDDENICHREVGESKIKFIFEYLRVKNLLFFGWIRRSLMWTGVRLFGWSHWN